MRGVERLDLLLTIECRRILVKLGALNSAALQKIFTFQQKNRGSPDASSSSGIQISSDA